ncbi:DUF6088 family protein [Treponema sp.]|uniref:DUF6088 family protein n=1 Tax=Treponema sp. TaxID=166 RepID=UPI003F0F94AF
MEKNTLVKQIELSIADSCNSEPGHVFSAIDYAHIGELNTIHQIFSRLEKDGKIKRIMQGLYYVPKFSRLLQEYEEPSPHEIALAIARKNRWSVVPEGNTALNQMGLSAQVSAKWSYISSGPYADFTYKNVRIEFKHRTTKQISDMSYKTSLLIQALKSIGKDNISNDDLEKLSEKFTPEEKEKILEESRYITSWIYEKIKIICKRKEASNV